MALRVFPNPCTDRFEVNMEQAVGNTTLTLLDLAGRRVRTWPGYPGSTVFIVSGVPAGSMLSPFDRNGTRAITKLTILPE
ncbi:MAG: T9SS type A sorting domain-containing protein [Flavobacteriales bacterium]